MKGFVRGVTLLLFTLTVVSACGNAQESEGGLGEQCYPDGTCDGQLVCADGVCAADDVSCPADKDCTDRECGPDPLCEASCGTCGVDHQCNAQGLCECVPDCTDRECGPDPVCEESCGTCPSGQFCHVSGQCLASGDCGDDCSEMVTVPAGPFWMGCNEAVDTECSSNEHPYHEVNVPAFEIDKYQVTMADYGACVGAGGCTAPGTGSEYCNANYAGRDDHPVNCINWYQARAYCEWAGKRLCSEAEWEKAARGTDGRKYPWGNEQVTCDYAVFSEELGRSGYGCGEGSTWPVGSKPLGESPYGAMDMVGNVFDCVEDDYHSSYEGAPTDGSAWVNEPRASTRVIRGSSFCRQARKLRASLRLYSESGYDHYTIGARCCR